MPAACVCACATLQGTRALRWRAPYTSAEYLKASYHTGIFHSRSNQLCRKATFCLLPPTLFPYTVISVVQFDVIRARAMQSARNNVTRTLLSPLWRFFRHGKKTGLQARHLQYCIFYVIYQTPSLYLYCIMSIR